jgi:hypothetical protein
MWDDPDWKYNPMLRTIVTRLGGGYWPTKLPALRLQLAAHDLTRKDAEHLISTAREEAKNYHKGRSVNYVALALAWNQERALAAARKLGIFRPTTYDLNHRPPSGSFLGRQRNSSVS